MIQRIRDAQVIAILRKTDYQTAMELVSILIEAGLSAIEITLDGSDALSIITTLKKDYPTLCIAAGTVLTPNDVQNAVVAGADFLISPHWDPLLFAEASKHETLYIPGVLTPTEVMQAHHFGVNVLKLFPASSLGPQYLQDLRGPFANTLFIPTGGITPETAVTFLNAGAVAVGMGSSLMPKKEISQHDWLGAKGIIERSLQNIRARVR